MSGDSDRDELGLERGEDEPHPFYLEFLRCFRDDVAAAALARRGSEAAADEVARQVAEAVRDLALLSPSRAEGAQLGAALREALGIVEREHDLQRGLADAIDGALRRRAEPAQVTALLSQLREAMTLHFAFEQLVMELAHDPQRAGHARVHARLLEQLADVADACGSQRGPELLERFAVVRAAAFEHMESVDAAIAVRLRGRAGV